MTYKTPFVEKKNTFLNKRLISINKEKNTFIFLKFNEVKY